MITFAVSDVKRGQEQQPTITLDESMQARSERTFEAAACNVPNLIQSSRHGFLAAVHRAFDSHHPLILSPDDVWLCLAQGFATHVNLHADALRHRFVRHEGKVELSVRRDDFVKGSPSNDWPGMFSQLSDRIAEHVGKRRDLFVADFSTTGAIEQAASEVVLFDAMHRYFDYMMMTMCGIPEITLLGTVDDWLSIRRRVNVFIEFESSASTATSSNESHWRHWTAALLPVLDKIVQTARGDVDPGFWQSLYKFNGQSGGPYVTGWINVLFPYLENQDFRTNKRTPVPNLHALKWKEDLKRHFDIHAGPAPRDFPSGLSSAPFTWQYYETKIPMVFMGGFAGVSQDPSTGAVRPAIGWAIGEESG